VSSGAPTKIEVLRALLRVLDIQAAEQRKAREEREERQATSESVLAAIRSGKDTWERLHAFFPEHQWKALGRALTALQRAESVHRNEHGTFWLGPRKRIWTAAGGYGNVRRGRATAGR